MFISENENTDPLKAEFYNHCNGCRKFLCLLAQSFTAPYLITKMVFNDVFNAKSSLTLDLIALQNQIYFIKVIFYYYKQYFINLT